MTFFNLNDYYGDVRGGSSAWTPWADAPPGSAILLPSTETCRTTRGARSESNGYYANGFGAPQYEINPGDSITTVVTFNLNNVVGSWNYVYEFGEGNAGRNAISLFARFDGQIQAKHGSSQISSGVLGVANTWYIAVIRGNGPAGTLKIRVQAIGGQGNAAEIGSGWVAEAIGGAGSLTDKLYITTASTGTSRGHDTTVQGLGIYRRYFSDEEVDAIFASESYAYGEDPDAIFYVPCDEQDPQTTGLTDLVTGLNIPPNGTDGVSVPASPLEQATRVGYLVDRSYDVMGEWGVAVPNPARPDSPLLVEPVPGIYGFGFGTSRKTSLEFPARSQAQPFATYCVLEYNCTGGVFSWGYSRWFPYVYGGPDPALSIGTTLRVGSAVPVGPSNRYQITCQADTVSSSIRTDGVERAAGTCGTSFTSGIGFAAGGGYEVTQTAYYAQLSPGKADPAYRDKVEAWLKAKYGTG
jgi:hypothetical protein